MNKTLILVVAIVLSTTPLWGQSTLYVPDNNPGSGGVNYWPFTTNGQAGPSWRYQFLINASYLLPKVINITDVAFAPSATTNFAAHQFQMRMANTTYAAINKSTCFDPVLGPQPTTVFNGPITYTMTASTWCPVGLQNSFVYDGKSNLVIEIRYMTTLTTLSGPTRQGPFHRTWTNGWLSNPDPYNSKCPEYAGTNEGPKCCFTYNEILITLSGNPGPGGTVDLDLFSAADAGRPYQAASSLGTGPIPIGTRQLYLTPDNLMVITVGGYLPTVFVGYAGKLDASGKAKARIKILNDPRLKGIRIHSAFITLDPAAPLGISQISNTATFTIT